MAIRPCPFKIDCSDPPSDSPLSNYSSEASDTLDFLGLGFNGYPPFLDPRDPTLENWNATSCGRFFTSQLSQADADLQALAAAILCSMHGVNPNAPIFLNHSQTCCIQCPDGNFFCYTLPAGVIPGFNQQEADGRAAALACSNAKQRRICLSSLSTTEICINTPYSGLITASGGLLSGTSNVWSVVGGSLPDGVNLSSFGGFNQTITAGTSITLHGTPTKEGNFNFTIRVTAPDGDFMQKDYSICVIDITPSSLPDATISTAYSQQLVATSCANQSQSWQVTTGALPAGLSIEESTGKITGIPTGPAGAVTFVVTMQDFAT